MVPSAAGTTTSPSTIADPALTCQASEAIFLKRFVRHCAAGEDLHRGVSEMNLDAVAIELDFMKPAVA